MVEPQLFKHISSAYSEAIKYMDKRRKGEVQSILTPWDKVNDSMMDGIEWNTINIIGARPGVGKTLMANMITRKSFDLNPTQDFMVLDFQLEMLARVSAIRELSGAMKLSMKQLNSVKAEGVLSEAEMKAAFAYFNDHKGKPIYIVERKVNVQQFVEAIRSFVSTYKKPTLITLDHAALVGKSADEKDRFETISKLGDAMTMLKKELPVTFLVLSQLNRDIESMERRTPGKVGNYPVPSDIYGSDSLLQHADNLVILNKPSKLNLREYGPEKFIIDDNRYIAYHLLKARNGDERLSWFMDDYANMNIIELHESEYPKPKKISF